MGEETIRDKVKKRPFVGIGLSASRHLGIYLKIYRLLIQNTEAPPFFQSDVQSAEKIIASN
ncbi:MAG: hypothetical protein D6722_24350, partial [Bacteroidetes bacterium]